MKFRFFPYLGFCHFGDFINSWIRPQEAYIFINFSLIVSTVEYVFGLKLFAFFALFILLTLELITGVFAAKMRRQKITSRRLQRFGVMILVWFTLLMVMNAFTYNYEGLIEQHAFHYMHSIVIFYIIGLYTKSVLENVQTIIKNKMAFKELIDKIKKVTDENTNS